MADPQGAHRPGPRCRRLARGEDRNGGDALPHRGARDPHGQADYALWLDGRVVAIVEAKKLTVGAQNVLLQAERYARGLRDNPYDFDGLRAPFIYSTNGEVIWFRDVRHPLNRSRRVQAFHTPNALREMLGRDAEAASARPLAMPNAHERLRPYQREANDAVERAIAERKRQMLVAMATGTGSARLDEDQNTSPARPRSGQQRPEKAIGDLRADSLVAPLVHRELMAKGEHLEVKGSSCLEASAEEGEEATRTAFMEGSRLSYLAGTVPPRRRREAL